MADLGKGPGTLMENITRKGTLVLLNFIIMGLIGLVSWYFVANNMPRVNVGIVTFAMSFGALFAYINELGFGTAHIKRISEGQDESKCIGSYLMIKVILTLLYITLVVVAVQFWKYVIIKGFPSSTHENMIYLMIGYHALMNLSRIGTQTLAANIETAKQQVVPLAAAVLQLVVTVIVVLSTNNVYLFGATFVVGALVNFVISIYFLSHYRISLPYWNLIKSYFTFALPVFVISIMGQLPNNIDRIMIQFFWNSDQVGVYTGGQKFSLYLQQIPTGIALIIFPTFSRLSAGKKISELKHVVLSSERLLALIMIPMVALMFALSEPIVTILGDIQYSDSAYVLMPLSIWALIIALNIPYSRLMMGIGKPGINALVSTISVSSMIILNLILIPKDIKMLDLKLFGLGPAGAAIATMLSVMLSTVLFRIFSYKYMKLIINPEIFRPMVAGGITTCVIMLIQMVFPVTRFYYLVLMGFVGLSIYLSLLITMHGFKKSDITFFKNVLNPLKMFHYIKEEVTSRKK